MSDHQLTTSDRAPDVRSPPASPAVARSRLGDVAGTGGFEAQASRLAPVQRHAVQRRGDGVQGVHEAAAHGISGAGGALPYGARIQQSFGSYDLSNVTSHTDTAAAEGAAAMGAEAYATGSDIAFAGAPDLHTAAHEAAHVVQQRAGVSLSGGVGQSGDAYERHADRVADAVVGGWSAEPVLAEMAPDPGGSGAVQRRSVQRAPLSTSRASDAQIGAMTGRVAQGGGQVTTEPDGRLRAQGASAAVNPKFEEDAAKFEVALGRAAYTKAAAPAQALAVRAKAYLTAKHGHWDGRFKGLADDLRAIHSDASWCGGVGDSVARIKSVFDSGNVRMIMQHIGKFYSDVMQKDMLTRKDEDYERWFEEAEIRVAGIKRAQAQAALENEVSGQRDARIASGNSDKRMGVTGTEMGQQGMPLHPSEQQAQAEAGGGGAYSPEAILAWNQGAKVWALNEANAWVALHRELSLPLAAGPSGTTKWLMEASLAIGGVTSFEARMACFGHLLANWHHSLSEIMAAAAPFGCNDFTPGPRMYRSITGFSESELKAFGGGKFPDEAPPQTGTPPAPT